jgi:hypothetical protein
MSINWHYFKVLAQRRQSQQQYFYGAGAQLEKWRPKSIKEEDSTLRSLTDGFNEDAADDGKVKVGRAWRASELRLKSHSDLHKLWYVLLKEKNKLKSDFLMSQQMQQRYPNHNSMTKVNMSMSRLLTVVNERKKLRNLYRANLEDNFIEDRKKQILARMPKTGSVKDPLFNSEKKRPLSQLASS